MKYRDKYFDTEIKYADTYYAHKLKSAYGRLGTACDTLWQICFDRHQNGQCKNQSYEKNTTFPLIG